jgi:hypothetical protein
MNALVGFAKAKPFADAAAESFEFSRSAVWFSRVSSLGLNHVAALQSSPWKIRGYPTTTTRAFGA